MPDTVARALQALLARKASAEAGSDRASSGEKQAWYRVRRASQCQAATAHSHSMASAGMRGWYQSMNAAVSAGSARRSSASVASVDSAFTAVHMA